MSTFPQAIPTGEQLTGGIRRTQKAIWDSITVAAAGALNTGATTKLFTTNVVDNGAVTMDVSNMRAAGMLPAGHSHLINAIRVLMLGGAADMTLFMQKTFLKLFYSGILVWEGTPDYCPAGAGIQGSAGNGIADPRAIYFFDQQPIRLEGQVPFRLEVTSGATGNAAAAFFARFYLDGVYSEPS